LILERKKILSRSSDESILVISRGIQVQNNVASLLSRTCPENGDGVIQIIPKQNLLKRAELGIHLSIPTVCYTNRANQRGSPYSCRQRVKQ
jgi:hypothetical protein